MTEEQATKLLIENEWCTFSDARELLLEAAAIGAKETMESIEPELRRLHAENEALKAQLIKATTQPMTERALAEYCLSHRTVDATDQFGEKVRGACHGVAP